MSGCHCFHRVGVIVEFGSMEANIWIQREIKSNLLVTFHSTAAHTKSKSNVGSESSQEENCKRWISAEKANDQFQQKKKVYYGCKLVSAHKMLTMQNSLTLGIATSCGVGLFITLKMKKRSVHPPSKMARVTQSINVGAEIST